MSMPVCSKIIEKIDKKITFITDNMGLDCLLKNSSVFR